MRVSFLSRVSLGPARLQGVEELMREESAIRHSKRSDWDPGKYARYVCTDGPETDSVAEFCCLTHTARCFLDPSLFL